MSRHQMLRLHMLGARDVTKAQQSLNWFQSIPLGMMGVKATGRGEVTVENRVEDMLEDMPGDMEKVGIVVLVGVMEEEEVVTAGAAPTRSAWKL